jgi:acyl-ACP thioesterase
VGVAEIAASGRIRIDAIARWAQDVAWADVEAAGQRGLTVWLVRRTRIRVVRFPRLGERYAVGTYVTGVGRMWAERRTDYVRTGETEPDLSLVSIWVHIDPERRLSTPILPIECQTWVGSETPRVSARLRHPAPARDAAGPTWVFRAAELDPAGHINNAAFWTPLDDELFGEPEPTRMDVELEYRTPAQPGVKRVLSAGMRRWIIGDPPTPGEPDEVHASLLLDEFAR